MHYAYTMINPELAICPIVAENDWQIAGIDGNMLHLSRDDAEKRVELPFYDGSRVSVEPFSVSTETGDATVYMLIGNDYGHHVCEVSAAWSRGQLFAIAHVVDPI